MRCSERANLQSAHCNTQQTSVVLLFWKPRAVEGLSVILNRMSSTTAAPSSERLALAETPKTLQNTYRIVGSCRMFMLTLKHLHVKIYFPSIFHLGIYFDVLFCVSIVLFLLPRRKRARTALN